MDIEIFETLAIVKLQVMIVLLFEDVLCLLEVVFGSNAAIAILTNRKGRRSPALSPVCYYSTAAVEMSSTSLRGGAALESSSLIVLDDVSFRVMVLVMHIKWQVLRSGKRGEVCRRGTVEMARAQL